MSELGSMSPHPASQRTTSRPDTLDSFNDADVDEYSTQVRSALVQSLIERLRTGYQDI